MKCIEIVGAFTIDGYQMSFKISRAELEMNTPEQLGYLLMARMERAKEMVAATKRIANAQ